jgi:hypothetical protein
MLFGETVAVYCENHTEHTNTLCGQNAGFLCVTAGGTYSHHYALNAYILYVCEVEPLIHFRKVTGSILVPAAIS